MQKEEEMKSELEQLRKDREKGRLELVTALRDTTKRVDDQICRLHQKQCILRKDGQLQCPIKHPSETIPSDPWERILGSSKYLFCAQKLVNYGMNPSLHFVLNTHPFVSSCALCFR